MLRFYHSIIEGMVGLFGVIGAMMVLSGIGIVTYQAYIWLRLGKWRSFSFFDVLYPPHGSSTSPNLYSQLSDLFVYWLFSPTEWIGLKKILLYLLDLPISPFLVLIGIYTTVMCFSKSEQLSNEHRDTLIERLGIVNPIIFEGPLAVGTLTCRTYKTDSPISSLFIEKVARKSTCLRVDFAFSFRKLDTERSCHIMVATSLRKPMPIRALPLAGNPQHAVPLHSSEPHLYIAFVKKRRTENEGPIVTYVVGEVA